MSKNIIKILQRTFCFIILIICALNFIACKSYKENKPWLFFDVEWYSSSPVINLTVTHENLPKGYLIINDDKIDINLIWGETRGFAIIYADCEIISAETILLSGVVDDFDAKSATLIIERDNVFNNKYKEIVLYRKAIDET